jgi:DNA-binding transcriptional ArsR family regulator
METGADNETDVLWNALAHSKRRQIVNLLREGPLTTSDICDHFEVSRFAVMKHLTVLEEAGLVKVKREGRVRWNILNESRLDLADLKLEDRGETASEASDVGRAAGQAKRHSVALVHCRLEQEWQLGAPLDLVYETLTDGVDEWWNRRVSADSVGVVLESWLDGRFIEQIVGLEGGFLLGRVSAIKPGAMLCLTGPLAMPGDPVHGQVCLCLEGDGEGTRLLMKHSWAAAAGATLLDEYEAIWNEMLGHLKAYVEDGASWHSRMTAMTGEQA